VFFALQPTLEQCRALQELVTPLVAQLGAQTVPPDNLHATLVFVGAVPEERLADLKAVGAATRAGPATLCFDALEYWAKPQIVCATATDPVDAAPARALAQRLGEGALAAGFTPDIKPFRPHLTLARKVRAVRAAALTWPQTLEQGLVLRCEKFALMQSRQGERGSIYSVVESWPLYAEGSV
jgi:2'-5' RNA ligase